MILSHIATLFVFLCLREIQIHGEMIKAGKNQKADLNDFTSQLKDTLQSIKSDETREDKSEDFDDINEDPDSPVSDVDFDGLNNALIIQFSKPFLDSNFRDSKANDVGFARYSRANNLMRFGKRQSESSDGHELLFSVAEPNSRYGRSSTTSRDSRGDNFMRFGRANSNLMRFGRSTNSRMRFGRSNANSLMRFGRANSMMRFGRPDGSLMRFGRANPNLMRFGRANNNLMRFGRSGPGRNDNFIRFGRNDRNFMRFGKLDQNFMRFGKRAEVSPGSHLDSDLNNKTNDNDLITSNIEWLSSNAEPDEANDFLNHLYDNDYNKDKF